MDMPKKKATSPSAEFLGSRYQLLVCFFVSPNKASQGWNISYLPSVGGIPGFYYNIQHRNSMCLQIKGYLVLEIDDSNKGSYFKSTI